MVSSVEVLKEKRPLGGFVAFGLWWLWAFLGFENFENLGYLYDFCHSWVFYVFFCLFLLGLGRHPCGGPKNAKKMLVGETKLSATWLFSEVFAADADRDLSGPDPFTNVLP